MSLGVGARLGHYSVTAKLGEGGMGEVWRATDTQLNRDVALKILPEAFATDPDRLARFQREAQVLASLNHPGIAAIYGIEEQDDTRALVLELVEGPTLADRISKGPIPLDEALPIARQIAEALEAAHEAGVIHRDLKPANIKVREDGTVKVLDFGLAKAVEHAPSTDPSQSPTLTAAATQMGVIMGTAAYMSPEQARGKSVDKRADIWAFGCVVYEVLTGQRAFRGDNATDTLASVVRADPEWNSLPLDTPPGTRRLLRRCLRKEPSERLRDVGDARLELTDVDEPVSNVVQRREGRAWWMVAAVALLVASYAAGVWRTGGERLAVEWRGELLGGPPAALDPRVSPSGHLLAFQSLVEGLTQVGIMQLQSGDWTIRTTDRSRGLVMDVAWAPDESSVYYDRFTDTPRGIYRVGVLGDEPRLVLDDAMTPTPLPDGSLVVVRYNEQRQRQLYRFWPETGDLEALNGTVTTLNPAVRASSDGRAVVFFGQPLTGPVSGDGLFEIDLESGEVRHVADIQSVDSGWTFPLALTRETAEALAVDLSGNLHRVVAYPLSGSGRKRFLFSLTGRPWDMDAGEDGVVYTDVMEQPIEILISDPMGREAERIPISNVATGRVARHLPLPDGRILMTMGIAGRNRVMAIMPDGTVSPLVETQQETSGPFTLVGRDNVALVLGSAPNQTLALVSTSRGTIEREFGTIAVLGVRSVAASPDGKTLFYASAGQVHAMDLQTETSSAFHPGESVAIDPSGEYAVVALPGQGGVRLMKVALSNGYAEEIPTGSEFAIAATPSLEPNAIAPDGRIAVRIAPKDSWFWMTGILDPQTGHIEKAWPEIDADMFAGWTEDGRLVASLAFLRSNLWRFVPQP